MHLSENEIEAYALRRLKDDDAEEHILNCCSCLDRVIEEEGWIGAIRSALR